MCVTGQHREMLDAVLRAFSVTPDHDLSIMKSGQTLFDITTGILDKIKAVLESENPDVVLVHGDTSTTFVTALACFYLQIPDRSRRSRTPHIQYILPVSRGIQQTAVGIIAKYNFAPHGAFTGQPSPRGKGQRFGLRHGKYSDRRTENHGARRLHTSGA